MTLNKLSFPPEKMADFDLEAFMRAAGELNRKNRETFTTPFPKDTSRLRSHYHFEPRPLGFTEAGEPEGGMSRLIGSVIDFGFVRSLFAPFYSKEGGHCYDPAGLFFLTLAAHMDGYSDYAAFCRDLRQEEKGRSYREMAGIGRSVPGEDDLCNFRRRVGSEPTDAAINIFVSFLREFGLVGEYLLSTDGQLEPSCSRFRGCAHFCEGCGEIPLTEEHREELARQLQAGEKQLRVTCPFPDAVEKIVRNTKRKGNPRVPEVILLSPEYLPPDSSDLSGSRKAAELLSLPGGEVPPLKITLRNLGINSEGELTGRCPKFPSDPEAGAGYHVDTQNPGKKERIFGYLHQKTTAVRPDIGLELPVGNSTFPAGVPMREVSFQHTFPSWRFPFSPVRRISSTRRMTGRIFTGKFVRTGESLSSAIIPATKISPKLRC